MESFLTSLPKQIQIGENVFIGPNEKTFIIAEIGQNHQGDLNLAKQMIISAKESGADCVKFQKTHLPSKFNKQALLRPYNGPNSWGCTYGAHKEYLEFSNEDFIELKRFSEINNTLFSSSVMDDTSLFFVNSLNVPFIKIGSGDFHNKPLIQKAANLDKPLIISTGMANSNEVFDVYNTLKPVHLNFCLLHCISSYPVPFEEISTSFIYLGSFVHSISPKKLEFISEGIIVVSGKKIVFIQRNLSNLTAIQNLFNVADKDVHKLAKGQFLIPGFVDTHIHGPQYPNIGLGYDLPLMEWLETYTFPLESKFVNESYAEEVYNAIVKKTLANGTTTACYFATIHKNSSCIFANCIKNLGQRAFVGKVNMNKNAPSGYGETFEASLNDTRAFIESILKMQNELIKPIITPRFALSCDMALMKNLGQLATEFNLLIQTHISENVEEVKKVKEEFPDNKNYLDVYKEAGLVNDKTILAHGIYLDTDELNEIKKSKATISHCPSSNILLQSGICPIRRYLNAGLKISLGTDCSGGSSCSMLDCIRQTLTLSIQASFFNMGEKLSLDEVFYLATLGGAEALHLANTTGNFAVYKDFDTILVDLNDKDVLDLLDDYNLEELFQKFIYLGDDRVIKKVFVAGKVVKQI